MLQKKLTSAIAVAIGASAVGLGSAQAGSILFPAITVSPTVTTIVSVMNAGDGYVRNGTETLHYRYYYKEWLDKSYNADDPNTVGVENGCAERNVYLPTSKNDIQTIDLGGSPYGSAGRGVMFNDQSENNDWDQGTLTYALGANLPGSPAAHRAMLVVDNSTAQFFGDLSGEAIVSEVVNGATWGYQAFKNIPSQAQAGVNAFNFLSYASDPYSLVAFMPADEVTTRFQVAVLADVDVDLAGLIGTVTPFITGNTWNATAHIGTRVIDPEAVPGQAFIVPGAYDRDENFRSGGFDRPVTCVGAWDIEDLFPDAIANVPDQWGWTNITNYGVAYETYGIYPIPLQTAAVFKVEFGDQIDGVPVGGIFNNGLYLHPGYMKNYTLDGVQKIELEE